MEKRLTYSIQIERDEDGIYVVSVPSLPGCFTQGRTIDEALQMAQDAIAGFISLLVSRGKAIPLEKKPMLSPFMVSIATKLAI